MIFDTDRTRIELRESVSYEHTGPIFLVLDPAEFILSAFEAERTNVIAQPPGFRDKGTHVRIDLAAVGNSASLQLTIVNALMELKGCNSHIRTDAQSLLWRLWLEVLIRRPAAIKTLHTSSTDAIVDSSKTPLFSYLSQALLNFAAPSPSSASRQTDTPNLKPASQDTQTTSALGKKLEENARFLHNGPFNIQLLQQIEDAASDLVLCLTGLNVRKPTDRQAVMDDIHRIQKALNNRAVAIINPENHHEMLSLNLARYPTAELKKGYNWIIAAPLFMIPTEEIESSTANDAQIEEATIEITSPTHPLLEALTCDLDAVRVAWIAANGSLRTLLRVGRRAFRIAESLETPMIAENQTDEKKGESRTTHPKETMEVTWNSGNNIVKLTINSKGATPTKIVRRSDIEDQLRDLESAIAETDSRAQHKNPEELNALGQSDSKLRTAFGRLKSLLLSQDSTLKDQDAASGET